MNATPHFDGNEAGTIYILHTAIRLYHAQHYIGWAKNLERRIQQHLNGRSGAGIVKAFNYLGVPIAWAVLEEGPTATPIREQYLKKRYKSARKLCPYCKGEMELPEAAQRHLDLYVAYQHQPHDYELVQSPTGLMLVKREIEQAIEIPF